MIVQTKPYFGAQFEKMKKLVETSRSFLILRSKVSCNLYCRIVNSLVDCTSECCLDFVFNYILMTHVYISCIPK